MPSDARGQAFHYPEKCAHRRPLMGPEAGCIDCDIAWEEWAIAQGERSLDLHRAKLDGLKAAKAAQHI